MSASTQPSSDANAANEKPLNEWLEKRRQANRQKAERFKAKMSEKIDDSRPARSRQEYLDFTTVFHSGTKPSVGPDATAEEKAEDRHRRLCALTTKHRRVFATWPRDPDGDVIGPDETAGTGKHAPNGIESWGNSLFDFYTVPRLPSVPNYILYTTGSRLLEWMKKHGETFAEDQLAMAEREPDPHEVQPYPVAEGFKDIDRRVKMFKPYKSQGKTPTNRVEFGIREPFVPIAAAPLLQERVPFRLLPKKLIVHDPSRLLRASYRSEALADEPKEWDAKPDIVSVYRLELSDEGKKKIKEEEDAIEKLQQSDRRALADFLANPTTENMPPDQGLMLCLEEHQEVGPATPALFITHGLAPVKEPIEEAHVYLSPHHLVGRGNHSYAFKVDWEIPRSMVVQDHLCGVCVIEKGLETMKKQDGPKDEHKDPRWNERSGEVVELVQFAPSVVSTAVDSEGEEHRNEDGEEVLYEVLPRQFRTKKQYRGPLRVIHTDLGYQRPEDGPLCKHLAEREQPPSLTAGVSVVAKLSHPNDEHLEREAQNYQEFPTHFFQHFTGFNQLPPLHDPFPVGALVPQFYGYYVPEDTPPMIFDKRVPDSGLPGEAGRKMWKETDVKYGYRSPIMLIENCGVATPMDVRELSIDDRETCASLFLRMHHAGWVQGSPYTRNVLMQSGPIDTFPLNRMVNAMEERSDLRGTTFRLIDFGRSEKFDRKGSDRMAEESRVLELFKLLHFSGSDD